MSVPLPSPPLRPRVHKMCDFLGALFSNTGNCVACFKTDETVHIKTMFI